MHVFHICGPVPYSHIQSQQWTLHLPLLITAQPPYPTWTSFNLELMTCQIKIMWEHLLCSALLWFVCCTVSSAYSGSWEFFGVVRGWRVLRENSGNHTINTAFQQKTNPNSCRVQSGPQPCSCEKSDVRFNVEETYFKVRVKTKPGFNVSCTDVPHLSRTQDFMFPAGLHGLIAVAIELLP